MKTSLKENMNEEEIGIAVAVALGTHTVSEELHKWGPNEEPKPATVVRDKQGNAWKKWHHVSCQTWHPKFAHIPALTLDWINEVVSAMPRNRTRYLNHLKAIVCTDNDPGSPEPDEWKIHTATAAQRAEAFLKVKGLWKDPQ